MDISNIELKDTIPYMESEDYKSRFIAEYFQAKIRYEKLHAFIVKYEAGALDFTPDTSLYVYKSQASTMGNYLYLLEVRAKIEDIDLDNVDFKSVKG